MRAKVFESLQRLCGAYNEALAKLHVSMAARPVCVRQKHRSGPTGRSRKRRLAMLAHHNPRGSGQVACQRGIAELFGHALLFAGDEFGDVVVVPTYEKPLTEVAPLRRTQMSEVSSQI